MIYLTVAEVAEILKVKKAYVYDQIQKGLFKTIRLSERRTRISSESLAEALEELSKQGDIRYTEAAQPPRRGRPRIGTNQKSR